VRQVTRRFDELPRFDRARVAEPVVVDVLLEDALVKLDVRARHRASVVEVGGREVLPVFLRVRRDPIVVARRVFVLDLVDAVEVVVRNLSSDGFCATRPFRGVTPIPNLLGIADDVVGDVEVLEIQLERRLRAGWGRGVTACERSPLAGQKLRCSDCPVRCAVY